MLTLRKYNPSYLGTTKTKAKLEAAAALKKSVYLLSTKSKQSGFDQATLGRGQQGGKVNQYGPGKSKAVKAVLRER